MASSSGNLVPQPTWQREPVEHTLEGRLSSRALDHVSLFSLALPSAVVNTRTLLTLLLALGCLPEVMRCCESLHAF